MKKMQKVMTLILAIVMMMSLMALPVSATSDKSGAISKDKTAQWHDGSRTVADVTLSVPGEVEGYVDVVFVLGGGMTANMQTIESAINVFKPAMENGQTTVRMGLISLEKGKEIILDLNSDEAVLDPATYVEFITEKFDSINDLPGGSTNLHSQLLEAQKMLEAETNAKAENKYVFVLATGRTYWFDDANGEQATIVNKVNGTYYWANYLWQSQRGRHSSLYMIPDRYNDSYEAFFADIEKWVAADGDTYVFTPHFDANDNAAYANWYAKNNKDLRALGIAGSRFGLGIVDPVPTAENFITGVPAGIGSEAHPLHALNYERAQYECVQVWKELVATGYNCYSICSESANYQNGSEYIKQGAKYTGTSTTQLGHSFMNYLATLAGQEFAPTVWDYERDAEGNMLSTSQVLKENFFASIEEDIRKTCAAGSYVEDYIGYKNNETDGFNFDFMVDGEITLTVGNTVYTTAKLDAAKEGFDASYTFTAPGAAEPTFWVDYVKGNGTTEEKFIWTFGEDIQNFAPAHLNYQVELVECRMPADTGTEGYIVETNQVATLYPVNGEAEEFPVPKLTVLPTYTVTYLNNGVEMQKTIEHMTGDMIPECEDPANYRENGYLYTFTGWTLQSGIEGENDTVGTTDLVYVANYTSVLDETDITVNKVWEDDDNFDGKRPESITIRLYADGEEIAVQTVTGEDNWSYVFENLNIYDNGEKIVYTITEDAVADYETLSIEGDAETGFTVINRIIVEVEDEDVPLLPETGDNIGIAMLAVVLSMMIGAVCILKHGKEDNK
jgi:hypothetical protein